MCWISTLPTFCTRAGGRASATRVWTLGMCHAWCSDGCTIISTSCVRVRAFLQVSVVPCFMCSCCGFIRGFDVEASQASCVHRGLRPFTAPSCVRSVSKFVSFGLCVHAVIAWLTLPVSFRVSFHSSTHLGTREPDHPRASVRVGGACSRVVGLTSLCG